MQVIIERGKVSEEITELPLYSVALDGRVSGPQLDPENHRYSFDHHNRCLRFCTDATCVQTWTAILGGLEPHKYTIWINDVDSDVCCSIWLLKNPDRCNEPLVKKLVEAIGLADMHAGAIPNNGMNKIVEWVSAPQTDSLRNGDYNKLSNDGLSAILEAMLHRITQYVNGEASIEIAERDVHSDFTIKRNENGWVLVESQDPHIYSSLWKAGFDRVVLIRTQNDKTIAVSLAKRTDFIDHFPLEKMYIEFNKLEPGWGGGSSIGGAVRNEDGSRTKLSLDIIIEIVNACVENRPANTADLIKKTPKKKTSKK